MKEYFQTTDGNKKAVLFRMFMHEHICPYGIKTKDLLKRKGFEVEDHKLKSQEETEQFKKEYSVNTTPQVFIDKKRIGGYDDVRQFFGKGSKEKDSEETSYRPVIAVFSTTFFMALATNWYMAKGLSVIVTLELFIAMSMCVLGILKLRDLYSFSNQFVTYDLLARKYVPYSYVYPFVETIAGIGMIAKVGIVILAPLAGFIGVVGATSVFKAVYVEKRKLKCACVGGDSRVPLGFISLTENLMMVLMATWMLVK